MLLVQTKVAFNFQRDDTSNLLTSYFLGMNENVINEEMSLKLHSLSFI